MTDLIKILAKAIKDASERTPYQVRYNHKNDTWEIWNYDQPYIVNVKSHDDIENSCEQMNFEYVAEKVMEVYKSSNQNSPEPKKPEPVRRDWHYDSQGYCDNPGRGY